MARFTRWLVTSSLVAVVLGVVLSGPAQARLSSNHNETVLRDRH